MTVPPEEEPRDEGTPEGSSPSPSGSGGPGDHRDENPQANTEGVHHQQVQVPSVTARVPGSIGSGVFSTGAIVMTGQHAFVLDFLQQMGVPAALVSRVILPHRVMPQFIQALDHNVGMYVQKFGAIPALPKPPQPERRPSVQEIYENLKLPDEELAGHYADGVIIKHSPAEFCFDFVTHFFPHAAVARRIFVSAPHVPQLLQAMKANFDRFQDGAGGPPLPPPPAS